MPCLTNPPEWRGVECGGQARLYNAESNPTRLTHPIRIYPTAPSNPSSVYRSMSVTDRYTQSQTRLHKSVTELDTATALWRRNAANAHLAAHSDELSEGSERHVCFCCAETEVDHSGECKFRCDAGTVVWPDIDATTPQRPRWGVEHRPTPPRLSYAAVRMATKKPNPATELNVATAHWRRNFANAHLAAASRLLCQHITMPLQGTPPAYPAIREPRCAPARHLLRDISICRFGHICDVSPYRKGIADRANAGASEFAECAHSELSTQLWVPPLTVV